MNNERHSVFFKAMMTGLFVGVIDTVICLIFNIIYRNETGYIPSSAINVSSLIFGINLILTLTGILFFACMSAFKKGDLLFTLLALVLTAWLIWKIMGMKPFGDPALDGGLHGLLGGITLVMGLSAACIPFLYRSQRFVDAVI